MYFTSIGRLKYDTHSQGGKKPRSDWWLVLETSPGLAKYYQYFIQNYGIKLTFPAFGSHVSVIKGEKVEKHVEIWGDKIPWIKDMGYVEFSYSNNVITDGTNWLLPIRCETLSDVRTYYGLSKTPRSDFHLTLGKTAYSQRTIEYYAVVRDIKTEWNRLYLSIRFDDGEYFNTYVPLSINSADVGIGDDVIYKVVGNTFRYVERV